MSTPAHHYVAVSEDFTCWLAPTKSHVIKAIQSDLGGCMLMSHAEGACKDELGNVTRWMITWRTDAKEDIDIYISRERIRI